VFSLVMTAVRDPCGPMVLSRLDWEVVLIWPVGTCRV
jgi:hypothetical protein